MGYNTSASSYGQLVVGRYNVPQGIPDSYINTDQAFIIGNGTNPANKSNALTVDWQGNL